LRWEPNAVVTSLAQTCDDLAVVLFEIASCQISKKRTKIMRSIAQVDPIAEVSIAATFYQLLLFPGVLAAADIGANRSA
jgi:hypothetical protein